MNKYYKNLKHLDTCIPDDLVESSIKLLCTEQMLLVMSPCRAQNEFVLRSVKMHGTFCSLVTKTLLGNCCGKKSEIILVLRVLRQAKNSWLKWAHDIPAKHVPGVRAVHRTHLTALYDGQNHLLVHYCAQVLPSFNISIF